ncbi:hypothetical protein RZN05_00320 [Sphingomonas sp. HF-S4]|uniref:Uncharacterized protein n=1 Tax=Sphingomonas agrestis TaxID=3080540 RepID=A0ABU3Y209_9SPHN|nr:hypothetical protein [Sphingomonas sp. HF-S4]MDV3455409.1 hypothetical protein [Sphingomonas sp. HF-S4]
MTLRIDPDVLEKVREARGDAAGAVTGVSWVRGSGDERGGAS